MASSREETLLYFAYGSNLCADDLASWYTSRGLPPVSLEPAGRAFLPDRCLALTHRSTTRQGGVLDIPDAIGCAVGGVLFQVTSEGMAQLDRKEREGHAYRRIRAFAITEDRMEAPVLTYEVLPERREGFVPAAPAYLEIVHRGYRAHGLDLSVLEPVVRGDARAGAVRNLFVYGTLRSGQSRHPILARHGATSGEAASTPGRLMDLGSYPGLIAGERLVAGEVYELADGAAALSELDKIESFQGFGSRHSVFRRALVRATTQRSCSLLCWAYIYVGTLDRCHEIVSGNWLDRNRS